MTAETNDRIDADIKDLTAWLSTFLCEDKDSAGQCLVVTEYLLRQYNLHSRPMGASVLLTLLLPLLLLPSSSGTFVWAARLIKLRGGIGLDEVKPAGCWSFLRGVRSFDRRALAARVARDNALSLIVTQMGENAASVSASEGGEGGGSRGGGTSKAMSLLALVLIESSQSTSRPHPGVA